MDEHKDDVIHRWRNIGGFKYRKEKSIFLPLQAYVAGRFLSYLSALSQATPLPD